jgi:hypothetical protein
VSVAEVPGAPTSSQKAIDVIVLGAPRADQGQAYLVTVFTGGSGCDVAAFGINALYAPASGRLVPVRVIAARSGTTVGFGKIRSHAGLATFELRANEVESPRPGDQGVLDDETFVVRVSRSGAILTGSCGRST